jgi:hypothetical protein
MSANLKAKLETLWKDISGEASTEAGAALRDPEVELAKVGLLVTIFKSGLATLVKDAEPGLKSSVTAPASRLGSASLKP